jgi:hypothetical protein
MNDQELYERDMNFGASILSTRTLLIQLIKVLIDDGQMTQEQLRRAVNAAKAELEANGDPVCIRASVMLEPTNGGVI